MAEFQGSASTLFDAKGMNGTSPEYSENLFPIWGCYDVVAFVEIRGSHIFRSSSYSHLEWLQGWLNYIFLIQFWDGTDMELPNDHGHSSFRGDYFTEIWSEATKSARLQIRILALGTLVFVERCFLWKVDLVSILTVIDVYRIFNGINLRFHHNYNENQYLTCSICRTHISWSVASTCAGWEGPCECE